MDDVLKGVLLWLYVSLAAVLGLGVLWIAGISTFWMLPELVDPPTFSVFVGLFLRIGILSAVSAGWTFVSVVGYRKLGNQTEEWFK